MESFEYNSFPINSILHREMYVGNMVQGIKHQRSRDQPMNQRHTTFYTT